MITARHRHVCADVTTQCDAGGTFVPSFEDAVVVAKEKNALIVMDMKAEGMEPEIKRILEKYEFYNVIASMRTEKQVSFLFILFYVILFYLTLSYWINITVKKMCYFFLCSILSFHYLSNNCYPIHFHDGEEKKPLFILNPQFFSFWR